MDVEALAREAGIFISTELKDSPQVAKYERFAALIREAVVQELVAGSGEPYFENIDIGFRTYTADQLAGAVLRERERCAKVCDETVAHHYMKQNLPANDEALLLAGCADCAVAIRGQT